MRNAISWFEIPVLEIERAARFYSAILGTEVPVVAVNGGRIGLLPSHGGVGGALVENAQFGYTPSQQGTLVYLDGGDDLSRILDRVIAAGGQVALPKTSLGDHGFAAYLVDTEGNRVGLRSLG